MPTRPQRSKREESGVLQNRTKLGAAQAVNNAVPEPGEPDTYNLCHRLGGDGFLMPGVTLALSWALGPPVLLLKGFVRMVVSKYSVRPRMW